MAQKLSEKLEDKRDRLNALRNIVEEIERSRSWNVRTDDDGNELPLEQYEDYYDVQRILLYDEILKFIETKLA